MTPTLERIVISKYEGPSNPTVVFDFQWYENSALAIKPQRAHYLIKVEGCTVNEAFGQASSQMWDCFQDFINDNFQPEEDEQEVLSNVLE